MSDRVARQLLRLIPRAVNPESAGGAVAALTGPEVAMLLSGLKPSIAVHMICARVLASEKDEAIVRGWMLPAVIRISHEDGWGDVDHEKKQVIASIVADEFYPGRCGTCRGRTEVPNARGIPEQCPACSGSGKSFRAIPKKAELVGVHERTWRRVWAARASSVLRYAQAVESQAFHDVHDRLSK